MSNQKILILKREVERKTKSQTNISIFFILKEMEQMRTSGMPRLAVPKFLINGKEPQGQRTVEGFSAMIDQELNKVSKGSDTLFNASLVYVYDEVN